MNLTTSDIAAAYDDLAARAETAGPDDWAGLFGDFNALQARLYGEGRRRRYAYTKDMRREDAEARDREYRESIRPAMDTGASRFVQLMLSSPHRHVLTELHGTQLLRVLDVAQPTLEAINTELRTEVGRLCQRYDKANASATVQVEGESLTLAQARGNTSSSNASLRRHSWKAWRGWYRDQRDALGNTFDELVHARHTMARNLGYPNFLKLGYAGMGRTDFGPQQSETFRRNVATHVVPVLARMREAQAQSLGVSTLRPWDVGFHPELTLPDGAAQPIDGQLDKAEQVFEALSPRLSEHFKRMRRLGLIDLENRPGKAAGAYCAAFPDENKVVIFCNSVGNERDVSTLFHEMGHAFQCWESQWIEPIALRWPTLETAEVHSMGMEFLSLPELHRFFGAEHARRFAVARWKKAVDLLCYVAVVDAFQHWIYTNPTASLDDRDAQWIALQAQFQPGEDWSDEAAPFEATRWYAQLHIFRYPFYYIDYALAEMGAMQLALVAARDRSQAMETYLELCRLGGTGSMMELLGAVGLRSPFDESLMVELMEHTTETLSL